MTKGSKYDRVQKGYSFEDPDAPYYDPNSWNVDPDTPYHDTSWNVDPDAGHD